MSVTLTAVALGLFALEHDRQLEMGVTDAAALERAQTTAVTGAVLLQALYLLSCRSLTRSNRELGWWSNPSVYGGIAIVVLLQAAFVMLPFMHEIFGAARIDTQALAAALAGALLILPVTALEERWRAGRSPIVKETVQWPGARAPAGFAGWPAQPDRDLDTQRWAMAVQVDRHPVGAQRADEALAVEAQRGGERAHAARRSGRSQAAQQHRADPAPPAVVEHRDAELGAS